MMVKNKRILLLSGEGVQVVSLARYLCRQGCEVSAICSNRISSGYCTRWLHRRYICNTLETDSEQYRQFLIDHLSQHSYDLIIPTADESAIFLSRHKYDIETRFPTLCAVVDYDRLMQASDKNTLMSLCEKISVPHPRTKSINERNIETVSDYIGFPALLKPDFSAGARGIVKVDDMTRIREVLPGLIASYGGISMQQYVSQPDYYYNVMLYRDSRGEITGRTIIKIRRYFPLRGGSSCYSETVECPEISQECEKILSYLDWRGFADFDVLVDKETNEFKIIEINPRVPSSLQAAFSAGVDFAECYVADWLGGDVKPYVYKTGIQTRWFGLDVMWFLTSPERFSFSPSWFRFWGKNVSYHDGSLRDPLPMIAGCLEGVIKYCNPTFRKSKLQK